MIHEAKILRGGNKVHTGIIYVLAPKGFKIRNYIWPNVYHRNNLVIQELTEFNTEISQMIQKHILLRKDHIVKVFHLSIVAKTNETLLSRADGIIKRAKFDHEDDLDIIFTREGSTRVYAHNVFMQFVAMHKDFRLCLKQVS